MTPQHRKPKKRRVLTTEGEELDVVAYWDERMNEVETIEEAFYLICQMADGEIEAIEIAAFPTIH